MVTEVKGQMNRLSSLNSNTPVRIVVTLALVLGPLVSSGCMTVDHLVDSEQPLAMYGGTKSSYEYIDNAGSPFFGSLIRIVDLPITVVGDTLLLPVSWPVEALR